jgi:hypothetical protein
MKPITFSCEAALPLAPEGIARQILDLTKWPDFHGYGPIPGIKAAEFEVQTPGIVGHPLLPASGQVPSGTATLASDFLPPQTSNRPTPSGDKTSGVAGHSTVVK